MVWFRITPACAGTTGYQGSGSAGVGDHPRLRGNNVAACIKMDTGAGSPPLAREQLKIPLSKFIRLGITPACAGTTIFIDRYSIRNRDHPRLRGNNSPLFEILPRKPGSPPLAREQRDHVRNSHTPQRITPACAGTTR